jgi:GNAT superfamily N-acetyltransferase
MNPLSWRRGIFEEYAFDRRTARVPGYTVEVGDDITRHLPQHGDDEALLWLARFATQDADRRITEELDQLKRRDWAAEWKLHDFDEPVDLKTRLEERGLRAHHEEALMILDVARARPRRFPAIDVRIEEASGEDLDEIASLQEEIWEIRLPWLPRTLHEMTHPVRGTAKVYCARTAQRIVGSGWIEFHGSSRFAQLCGGGLLEDHRGRGIYSRLFQRRIDEARARGVPYIAVDAAPMSRPILERRGFEFRVQHLPDAHAAVRDDGGHATVAEPPARLGGSSGCAAVSSHGRRFRRGAFAAPRRASLRWRSRQSPRRSYP